MEATPLSMLLAALVGLGVGPVLARLWPRARAWREWVDGVSLVLVGGLCVLHLVPHALEHGGLLAVLAGLLTALSPRLLSRFVPSAWWPLLGLAALAMHAAVDGAALATMGNDPASALGLAVVAHRLPVGLVVFTRARSKGSTAAGWAAVAILSAATVGGFLGGPLLAAIGPSWVGGVLEAVVAGTLLHVLFERDEDHACDHDHHHHGHDHHEPAHHHHGHEHTHHHRPAVARHWAALGALTGGALVVAFTLSVGDRVDHIAATVDTFVELALDSAPALLAGYVLAGLVIALMSPAHARWLGGGSPARQALRGVVFGLPLPVCSCGVLPLYASLVRRGVPATAGLAFLVATPELGLDAILLSIPLLGGPMTLARVGAAFVVALAVAWFVGRSIPSSPSAHAELQSDPPSGPLSQRLQAGLQYGLGELVDHTLPWIGVGLVVAALLEPLLAHEALGALPSVLQVPLFALIGIPVYVCAAGATPLAAIFVHKSVSAGAALAFLLAGPATNLTTFGVLSQLHSRGTAIRFGLAVVGLSVLLGWGLDAVGISTPQALSHAHHHGVRPLAWACVAGIGALATASLWRQGPRGALQQIVHPVHV